jgi:hypothetical protein
MKHLFLTRKSKATIDILLLVGLVLSIKTARTACYSWGSYHCIVSMIWYALMLVHIWQHWAITKAVSTKWKILKRNPVTFLTIVVFVLMTLNIIVFVFKVNDWLIHVHHVIAHVFWAVIIIHAIAKTKSFIRLFKRNKNENMNIDFGKLLADTKPRKHRPQHILNRYLSGDFS